MVEHKPTSEEKLLHIIEKGLPGGGKKTQPGIPASSAASVPRTELKHIFTLASLSRAMMAVCLLLTLVWFVDLLQQRSWFARSLQRLSAIGPADDQATSRPQVAEKETVISDLQNEASSRNIFTLYQVRSEEKEAPEIDYGALVKELRLVGILWSVAPQAMVENTKEGKTSLLSAKDAISEFTVVRILQDRIVLGKDGKEWELR